MSRVFVLIINIKIVECLVKMRALPLSVAAAMTGNFFKNKVDK